MTSYLSNSEISTLQAMWKLKAIGAHGVTLEQFATRLSNVPKAETSEALEQLQARGLVTKRNDSGGASFALTFLGMACVRELQDTQLSDLTRNP